MGVDLSSPLSTLIPTLEAVVLEVLAGTESALGVTQIHRLASRGSRRSFEPVLARLVEHGLVTAEPVNRGHLYRLNRDHLLAPVVLTAANGRSEFFDRLTDAVERLDPVPLHASVFGSVARREAGRDSDIDLFIVVAEGIDPRSDGWMSQMLELEAHMLRLTGNRVESLVFTAEHLLHVRAEDESIIDSLLADGIRVAGTDLQVLLAKVPS